MTKDWDSVRSTIRQLSVNQKHSLEDVKSIMESKHNFRASTRAYRMKLKEWGYLRHRPRKGARTSTEEYADEHEERESTNETVGGDGGIESPVQENIALLGDACE
jgi:hypothetical protein